MYKYKVVDLFAGAGGLSLGFMQAGGYEIKVAFENSPCMQETYRKNHPKVDVRGDVCATKYAEIEKKYGSIDVVIGGPPCQGFSNANRQRSHAINQNNMLVREYIRAITELQPKAFVMENVSMLRSDVHRFYLNRKDLPLLKKYSIPNKKTSLVLLGKELVFPGIKNYYTGGYGEALINKDLWGKDQYATLNVIYKVAKNSKKLGVALSKHKKQLIKYAKAVAGSDSATPIAIASKRAFEAIERFYEGALNISKIRASIEPAVMYQRMLGKMKEIRDNKLIVDRWDTKDGLTAIVRSYAVFDYLKAILGAKPNDYVLDAKVLCAADYGAPQKRMRFIVVGIKNDICKEVKLPQGRFKSDEYRTVRDAIADLSSVPTVVNLKDDIGITLRPIKHVSALGGQLRDSNVLKNHLVTKTTDVAMERFKAIKQGQNFHSLDESLKINTYTDITRTQNTIYLRLNYEEPCGTVTNVRKSMWIHPKLDRAISVREAARLQTFPDSFIFYGSKDKQYQQVGNAVPPILAKAIARKLAQQLNQHLQK